MTVASAPARPAIDEPRKLIGIVPPSAAHARVRLLDALEQAFPVRFEGRPATGLTGLDGVLVIAGSDPECLAKELARLPACPRLVAFADDQSRSPLQLHTVALAASRVVTRALRGRALREECRAAAVSVAVRAGDDLLALAEELDCTDKFPAAGNF